MPDRITTIADQLTQLPYSRLQQIFPTTPPDYDVLYLAADAVAHAIVEDANPARAAHEFADGYAITRKAQFDLFDTNAGIGHMNLTAWAQHGYHQYASHPHATNLPQIPATPWEAVEVGCYIFLRQAFKKCYGQRQ